VAYCLGGSRSIHLSYGDKWCIFPPILRFWLFPFQADDGVCLFKGFLSCFPRYPRIHYDSKHSFLIRLLVGGLKGICVLPASGLSHVDIRWIVIGLEGSSGLGKKGADPILVHLPTIVPGALPLSSLYLLHPNPSTNPCANAG
jgi:hypothetical protein